MEIYDLALKILEASSIEEKLFFPKNLTDHQIHSPLLIDQPNRDTNIQFKRHERSHKLPSFQELGNGDKRAACLHRFAGHELLAVEMMAWALLAFPKAPKKYRLSLAYQMHEEQIHVGLYLTRLEEMGVEFGNEPLFKHFWGHIPYIHSMETFISCMNLTFEQANLDFAPLYGKAFAIAEDLDSSKLMETILKDEIRHVRLGVSWLKKLKSKQETLFGAWKKHLPKTIHPKQSKGFVLHKKPRIEAGIPTDWIEFLKR